MLFIDLCIKKNYKRLSVMYSQISREKKNHSFFFFLFFFLAEKKIFIHQPLTRNRSSIDVGQGETTKSDLEHQGQIW